MIRITLNGVPPSLNRYLGKANGQAYRQAKAEWVDPVVRLAVLEDIIEKARRAE